MIEERLVQRIKLVKMVVVVASIYVHGYFSSIRWGIYEINLFMELYLYEIIFWLLILKMRLEVG